MVFTAVFTSEETPSCLPLAMPPWTALTAVIKWYFLNFIIITSAYPLKNFTRKQCPNLVESILLHDFFRFYDIILLKEEVTITNIEELRKKYINNPPEGLTSKDIRYMSGEELLNLDYFLNEDDLFDDEAGMEDF